MNAATAAGDSPQDWRLDERVAVVTASGSGLGRGIALVLADAGATVVCADGVEEAARDTARAILDAGGRAEAVALEVTDKAAVSRVVGDAARLHGRLDVLCNIGGDAATSSLAELGEAAFDDVFDAHFKGTLFGCQAALEVMAPAGRGAIVNMSSAAIDSAPPRVGAFAVAKASVSMLTRVLAGEAGRSGIRVNAIAPGLAVHTPAMNTDEWDRASLWESDTAPLGAVAVGDVAAQALYLASDASRFVTGQTVRINGGSAMPW